MNLELMRANKFSDMVANEILRVYDKYRTNTAPTHTTS